MRFKLRTAMVGVAIVTILLCRFEMSRREEDYRARAFQYAHAMATDEDRYCSLYGAAYPFCVLGDSKSSNCDFSASLEEEFAACLRWRLATEPPTLLVCDDVAANTRERYHHRMYHKWMRAAARPWRSVDPDEPPK